MNRFNLILLLTFSPVISWTEKLPEFKLDSLALRFDKSSKYYIDRPFYEREKSYTKDYRELSVVGRSFPKSNPLIIMPTKYVKPKSPYEAIANYFFTVKQRDIPKIVSLYDSVGSKHVDSSLNKKEIGEKFMDQISKVEAYEINTVFEVPNLIIIYGRQCTQNSKLFNPMYVTKEKGAFKIKAGLIDISFWQTLGGAILANDTTFIIKK
jgi:hypothetical protein